MVGPGKPIDTDRFFVICPNVLGGCMGTTGPASRNPATGEPYGLSLPGRSPIRDMVRAQAMLLDHLGIETLFCVTGGSMGGMQALQWAASYPDARVRGAAARDGAARHSAQNIAFHEVGRQAIMADPDWRDGRYLARRHEPAPRARGRAHGRAHHLSLRRRAAPEVRPQACRIARRRPSASTPISRSRAICAIRARCFVERFDANTYLYITRAMDYFDLAADYGGVLANAFKGSKTRFCVVSFTSDWLFPTTRRARRSSTRSTRRGASVSFAEIETDKGHDAFLLDEPELFAIMRGFLEAAARARGIPPAKA